MTRKIRYRNVCIAIGFVLLVFALFLFTSAVAQEPAVHKNPYLVRTFLDEEGAAKESNLSVTPEPSENIQELQQWIYNQGYNFTVAKNWITELPPGERERIYGYKPLKPPTGPLPENVHFRTSAEISQPIMVGQSLVGQPPSAYDARTYGYVTPVKNQGYCGSCWIFGAIADFESDVAISESNLLDFSEQEVGDCNIWERFCNGGNAYMTTNYFTKKGAAAESCHTYLARTDTCQNCPILQNVDNWRIITDSSGNELSKVDTIKNAIMNYGPVYTTIYAHGTFDGYDGGVYEYWGIQTPNHVIQIIGWNDSLPHTHGNGAWLIKNSWGTSWGINGYGWVAYGSANLGDDTSAISGYNNADDQIHYHDEYGWYGAAGCSAATASGAVRFVPTQCGLLHSVDFWAVDPDMQYEIRIFDTLSGGPDWYTFSNQLGSTQTGITNEEGYYSIPLETPLWLGSGDDFIIQVKFTTTTGYNFPIPIDYEASAVVSGESYMSCDGNNFQKRNSYDIGIRARQSIEECGQCLGDCYSGPDCTGDLVATNIPCYACIGELGAYWKPNQDSACFAESTPSDLCLSNCPQCCNGIDDDDPDDDIDFPADDECTCGLDPSESMPMAPIPELPTIALFSLGLLALTGYVLRKRA